MDNTENSQPPANPPFAAANCYTVEIVNFRIENAAYEKLEEMRKACGYADLGALLCSAATLKATVDDQFREGFTTLRCHNPKDSGDWRELNYTPSSV